MNGVYQRVAKSFERAGFIMFPVALANYLRNHIFGKWIKNGSLVMNMDAISYEWRSKLVVI